MFNNKGDMNAYSAKDAFRQVAAIVQQAQASAHTASMDRQAQLDRLASDIQSAHFQNNAANFGVLGEEITDEIRQTVARTGFIRRFLQERELQAGQECKIYLRKQDTLAFSATTDSATPTAYIKQREIYLRESYVNSHIQIEEKEISRLRGDILQEKLEDGYEMVQVQEDRMMKQLADASASALNVPVFFSNLSPSVYQSLKNQVESRGLPVKNCWLANNLWNDIVADDKFSNWFEPVTKHELIMTGELGQLLGVTLHTDAFINSQLRVLQPGEIYFFSQPKTLGQLLIRKQLASDPINKNVIGVPARGWFISEIVAPCIANANGVSKGRKL
jgi:hypothetical protein